MLLRLGARRLAEALGPRGCRGLSSALAEQGEGNAPADEGSLIGSLTPFLPAFPVKTTGFGEFVSLAPGAPVLVRLLERPWGAVESLPAARLAEAGLPGEGSRG